MDAIQLIVDPMGWRSFGGDASEALLIGDQLLVYADQQTHDVISHVLRCIRSNDGRQAAVSLYASPVVVATHNVVDLLDWQSPTFSLTVYERAEQLADTVQELIEPESWLNAGGENGALLYLNGRLIIAATAENQHATAQLLAALRAADGASQNLRLAYPTPHVAVYDIEPFLDDRVSEIVFKHRPIEMSWREMTREERSEAVARTIRAMVAPESWLEEGGRHSRSLHFNTRLIISTSPDNHAEIAELLHRLATETG